MTTENPLKEILRSDDPLKAMEDIELHEIDDDKARANEALNERYCDLLNKYGSDPETHALFSAILEVRHAPQDEGAQFKAISLCLAELLENNFLPDALRTGITDGIIAAVNATELGGFDSPEVLRAGGLVPVLGALLQRELPSANAARA